MAVALKATSQLDLSVPLAASVQELGVTLPVAGLTAKLTVPSGGVAVPLAVSVTVAVQVVGCPTTTDDGEQLTVVPVERFAVTVTVVVPELPECVESPL